MNQIEVLADRQLQAYNQADIDRFCECYHPDVIVLDEQGKEILRGGEAFRSRYEPMFQRGHFGADVPQRLSVGEHCVDKEIYWKDKTEEQEAIRGEVLVRYSLRDGLIGVVQFLK